MCLLSITGGHIHRQLFLDYNQYEVLEYLSKAVNLFCFVMWFIYVHMCLGFVCESNCMALLLETLQIYNAINEYLDRN